MYTFHHIVYWKTINGSRQERKNDFLPFSIRTILFICCSMSQKIIHWQFHLVHMFLLCCWNSSDSSSDIPLFRVRIYICLSLCVSCSSLFSFCSIRFGACVGIFVRVRAFAFIFLLFHRSVKNIKYAVTHLNNKHLSTVIMTTRRLFRYIHLNAV